jgi:D-xylose transport system ATP-binding protein
MVAELIEQLKAEGGIGIFLIDHDVHQVKKLCDRAGGSAVMKNGQLVGTWSTSEIRGHDGRHEKAQPA